MSHIYDYSTSVLSIGAEVGGWQDGPAAAAPTTVFLSHATPGQLTGTSFSVNFEIRGNAGIYAGYARDGFGFALRDSGNGNLIRVLFTPEAGGTGDAYRIGYTVGSSATVMNALDQNNSPMYVHSLAEYSMTFGFVSGGADPKFSTSIQALGTTQTARVFGGTATGLGSANVDRFGAEWNVVAGGAGNNGMVFDNLSVVPGAVAQPLRLTLTLSGQSLGFSWPCQAGKRYNLRSSTDLLGAPATWPLVQGNIAATPPTNLLSLARPADPRRFYVVEEYPAPP